MGKTYMGKTYMFRIPTTCKDKYQLVKELNLDLKYVVSNQRTAIYQNSDMRLSLDKTVARVLLFDGNNRTLLEKIRKYFYGEEYMALGV